MPQQTSTGCGGLAGSPRGEGGVQAFRRGETGSQMQHGAAQAFIGIAVRLKAGGQLFNIRKEALQPRFNGFLRFCGKLGEGLHGARRVPVHRRSLRVHERLGQQTGVGFPEMGPQQPAQLGVAGIDLRALERQCAVIPLPGGENEISGHI